MPEKWIEAAISEDVPEQGTLQVNCGSDLICLYKIGGNVYATQDECSHGSASLSEGFIVEECLIECPLHQGSFDIKTGKAVSVPCKDDIRVYPVKIENGKVFVQVD
jgi:nitrite reductase/ring-hydroxylating ferredoxin subunit